MVVGRRRQHGRAAAGRGAGRTASSSARRRFARRARDRVPRGASRSRPRARPSRFRSGRRSSARARFGVDLARGRHAPLVGRERELALLASALARARERALAAARHARRRARHRQEPARLRAARTIVEATPELIYWRQGRSLPYGDGVSFWALGEMVKAQAGILETRLGRRRGGKLGRRSRRSAGGERGRLGRAAPAAARRARRRGRRRPTAAPRRSRPGAGSSRRSPSSGPLVLVFEDLHWADDGLLDFVDHLVDWVSGVPLLVVCTARPSCSSGGRAGAAASRTPRRSRCRRSPTTRRRASSPRCSSGRSLAAEPQTALLARAGGNPLYAEQFVRMLRRARRRRRPRCRRSCRASSRRGSTRSRPTRSALLQDAAVSARSSGSARVAAIGDATARRSSSAARARAQGVRPRVRALVGRGRDRVRLPPRARARRRLRRRSRARAGPSKHGAPPTGSSRSADRRGPRRDARSPLPGGARARARRPAQDTDELAERARLALARPASAAPRQRLRRCRPLFYAALDLWPESDAVRPRLCSISPAHSSSARRAARRAARGARRLRRAATPKASGVRGAPRRSGPPPRPRPPSPRPARPCRRAPAGPGDGARRPGSSSTRALLRPSADQLEAGHRARRGGTGPVRELGLRELACVCAHQPRHWCGTTAATTTAPFELLERAADHRAGPASAPAPADL